MRGNRGRAWVVALLAFLVVAAVGSVIAYRLATDRQEWRVFDLHTDSIRSLAFLVDGELVAAGCDDSIIRIVDAESGRVVKTLEGHSGRIESLSLNRSGETLASGGADHTVRLWDVVTGACRATITDNEDEVHAVAFSPAGGLLATAEKTRIRIRDAESGRVLRTIPGAELWWGDAVSFSSDGKLLAGVSEKGDFTVWSVENGEALFTRDDHSGKCHAVAFSPSGNTLASGADGDRVMLWNGSTGEKLHDLSGISDVRALRFSPDGRLVAAGGRRFRILVWDVSTGAVAHELKFDGDFVNALGFSADGAVLASGDFSGTVRLWRLDADR